MFDESPPHAGPSPNPSVTLSLAPTVLCLNPSLTLIPTKRAAHVGYLKCLLASPSMSWSLSLCLNPDPQDWWTRLPTQGGAAVPGGLVAHRHGGQTPI